MLISHIQTLEQFISVHVPKIEDGNNFGVTVQLTVSKYLTESRDKMEEMMPLFPNYLKERAEAVEKLSCIPKSTLTETKTKSSSESTGGKDGDENKTSSSVTKEEKTVGTIEAAKEKDYYKLKHIVAIDVQCFSKMRLSLNKCIKWYLTVLDNMEKNKSKLTSPKGSGAGQSHMSMY